MPNAERLRAALADAGLDALAASSPEGVFYLSGVKLFSMQHIRERLAFAVWTADGLAAFVSCGVEESFVRRHAPPGVALHPYAEFRERPTDALAAALRALGLARGRIGVERRHLPGAHEEALRTTLLSCQLAEGDAVLDRARAVKTAEEIAAMRGAAQGVDRALWAMLHTARPVDSEQQLVATMVANLARLSQGEFQDFSWGLAAGANLLTIHHTGGRYQLAPGDLVRANLRATYDGYYAHLYRMAVVAPPPPGVRDAYARAAEVHRRAIDRLRPGAALAEVFTATNADLERAGFALRLSHVGHSTGVALHENPRIQPLAREVVEPGMVFAVEPAAVVPGEAVYHVEDQVLVTPDGPELLSDVADTRSLFVIR